MPNPTQIMIDDAYEEIAATFQCLEIERLNEVLVRNGVADKSVRMTICGEYAASVGALIDQFWFEAAGRRVHPVVAFSREFTGDDADPANLGEVFWRTPAFAFTEYAYGDTSQFFEKDGESLGEVPSGSVYESSPKVG